MKRVTRVISFVLVCLLLVNTVTINRKHTVLAATEEKAVKIGSLGSQGTVSYGKKTKSGTWYKMSVDNRKAFCMDLGKACHNDNVYEKTTELTWDQTTGGEKYGFYAKVMRWFVVVKKRTDNAYTMSQALVWAIDEGMTSKKQLTNIIEQVCGNVKAFRDKDPATLYKNIFEPDGSWTVKATIWQKSGGSKSYQRLLVVDAQDNPECKFTEKSDFYRQRITLNKTDELGKGLGGIEFTLEAHNLDDLYSFSINDRNGLDSPPDFDDETEFVSTGITRDNGRIAWRMTYWITSKQYAYYTKNQLDNMTKDEKEAAKKYLTKELDLEEGVDFGENMTKAEADELAAAELKKIMKRISNTYTLTENGVDEQTGNLNVCIDKEYSKGVEITLKAEDSWVKNDDGEWPDILTEPHGDYSQALQEYVTNKYKKIQLKVVKEDGYSLDGKAHGDATLDGAVFGIYEDAACTKKATFYTSSGTHTNNTFETVNGSFITNDYLLCGKDYYIKELEAPEGYKLNTEIVKVTLDGSNYTDTLEHLPTPQTVTIEETPKLGRVEIQKTWSDPDHPEKFPEAGATFQIYLEAKDDIGGYNACSEYERDTLVIDENGYATSKELYCGKYIIHQVNTGGRDTIMIDNERIEITEDGKTLEFSYNDTVFKAYLKIIKKDDNTGATVLKKNTKYKIYRVTNTGSLELVEQEYQDRNGTKIVSEFVSDENGEVVTVQGLASGTYRIFETDSATGLHITKEYIEVEINSALNNYTTFTDNQGNTHALVTMEYTNEESYGQLQIYKKGETLSSFENGKFVYKEEMLKGAEFEVYADGDIVTQDNQGTKWFNAGEKVATIISGENATFTKNITNLTGYKLEQDGTITLNLPLGKYIVKETKAPNGYLLNDKEWEIEFNWTNMNDKFVINSTNDTDTNGLLSILNNRAKAEVLVNKTDKSDKPIADVVFGVYSTNAIYNAQGTKIVDANQKLGTITTNEQGKASVDFDLPLGDKEYQSGEALNSGDYYLIEESAPKHYVIDDSSLSFNVSYKNNKTPIVTAEINHVNKKTSVQINKTSIAGSDEIDGCLLEITDSNGEVIVSWTSGSDKGVVINDKYADKVETEITADKHRVVTGLDRDTEYVLVEKRPADGYVTADSIKFKLGSEKGKTTVFILGEDGNYQAADENIVHMIDEQTNIIFNKKNEDGGLISGAEIVVKDSNGDKVAEFTTSEEKGQEFIGKLVVGETYTFEEVKVPEGFIKAEKITYTIADTKDQQIIEMIDMYETNVQIDKTSIAGSDEIDGCLLEITDINGEVIVSWTSGSDEGVVINDKYADKIKTELTDDKHRIVTGLDRDTEYVLVEKRPADGYVTADSIKFKLSIVNGNTIVSILGEDGNYQSTEKNLVHMIDEQTNIIFKKLKEDGSLLSGAKIVVKDSNGEKVAEFTTNEEEKQFVGVFTVGETYTFEEVEAPKGYQKAKAIKYTIVDTKDQQIIEMVDKKYGTIEVTPHDDFNEGQRDGGSPQTGDNSNLVLWFALLILSGAALTLVIFRNKRGSRA